MTIPNQVLTIDAVSDDVTLKQFNFNKDSTDHKYQLWMRKTLDGVDGWFTLYNEETKMYLTAEEASETVGEGTYAIIGSTNYRIINILKLHDSKHFWFFKRSWFHMWLIGCLNPYEMQESWECTFLDVFNYTKTK